MNKQLKLLQRSKVSETLEVEKVKHNLSKIENSNIVMVAYDDATNKFLIGDNSGNLYVATPEYLNSLDVKNTNIEKFISNLTKSSIAEHFNKVTIQEVKKMFGDKYFYYWSANDKVYGVRTRLIEQLDNGPDNTKVVELWDRSQNVLSNDRGVTGLKEVKFSAELRPAFLTFSENALPTYTRDKNLVVRDPVEIADIMNKDLQNNDYVPNGKKYGYDMKDSNAVLKSYLCTDDLVVLSNIDKREVIDIDPPNVDPDNPDVEYTNNTPFNHNYNMVWSTIRSARLFEEFNDENEDDHSQFANMTRHEQNELIRGLNSDNGTRHVDASGLYANVPNLYHAYTTYIEGDRFGEKQIYNNGMVGISIKNEIKYSLDSINGKDCVITKRVYNTITGEVENAKRVYGGKIEFSVNNIKNETVKIKRKFIIPVLNNRVLDFDDFEYKLNASGKPISLPVPEEIVDGIIEYNMDQTTFDQGTDGNTAYGTRKISILSGDKTVLIDTTNSTGTAVFTPYTISSDNNTISIKRTTKILFKNTDKTEYSYETSNNNIGTGDIDYLVSDEVNYSKDTTHYALHTREIHYLSGATDVLVFSDISKPSISYEIFNLSQGAKTATLKGSSTATFYKIVNGAVKDSQPYNISKSRHITVTSNEITYTRNKVNYVNSSTVNCSQTLVAGYTFDGVTINKSITKSASISHTLYTLSSTSKDSATIKRSFKPVFYTISNGEESTGTIYKDSEVIIDYPKTATVFYTVSKAPTGLNENKTNHTATHTRDVYYSENDVTIKVTSETYSGDISYTWKTLSKTLDPQFYGSSTGRFSVYEDGEEKPDTRYLVSQTQHLVVDCDSVSVSDKILSYTKSNQSAISVVTGTYTFKDVTISLQVNRLGTSGIDSEVYTLSSESINSATITRSYTAYIEEIIDGKRTSNVYISETRSLPSITATVSYGTLTAVQTGTGTAISRTISYTCDDNSVITYMTTTSSNRNSYIFVKHTGTTVTFYNKIYARFNIIKNGEVDNTTIYTGTSIKSDTKTASVEYCNLNMYSEWNGNITLKVSYNGITIHDIKFTPTINYSNTFTRGSKYFKGNRKITASENLTIGVSGSSPIEYSYSDKSINSVSYSYMCQNTEITSNGTLDIYPVMSAAADLTFKTILNGVVQSSTTYNRTVNYNHYNKITINTTPGINYSFTSNAAFTINKLTYGSGNYIYVKGGNTDYYKAGTAVTGSVDSVTHSSKGGISGDKGSAGFTVEVSATWNSISISSSTEVTKWFNGASYLTNVSGKEYDWTVYDHTNTVTCTRGSKSATARYRSNNYTRSDKYQPSSSSRSVSTWWSEAYSF